MKIVLASESFPPNVSGVATATKNLAVNLTKNGHEAFVFTPGSVKGHRRDHNFSDYEVIRIASIPNPFRNGFRITFISKNKIKNLLKEINPDLIHLQDPASIGTLLRDAGKELGIPVVITNHFSLEYALSYVKGLTPIMPLVRQSLIAYLKTFYNKCDQVITPTETFAKQIRDWGVAVPVQAVSNGIEIDKFLKKYSHDELEEFRQKYHLPENPLILYLGRVDKDKSCDVIVRSIPEVVKHTNAHFVITGSGGEVENLKRLASELKIDDKITFLGFLDHANNDVVKMYHAASLFAIPSTIETQSIVTLEALSSKLPVIAADAGALPELVIPGKDGYLIKPGDHKSLSKYIIELISDDKKRRHFGEYGLTIAMHHQMDRAFGEMLELYQEVIKNHHKLS